MSDTALTITIAYTITSIIGITIGLIVFRSTRVGFRVRTAGRRTLERRESYWGIAVITFLVLLLAGTITQIPYGSDDSEAGVRQRLEITGRQFAWTVDPVRVRADVKTKVEATATDVSHAVGIYDPDNTLIKQVNIVPGVTQPFVITFEEPGTYKLRCLEFCGVDHHLMESTLEVTR
jgi:cytochrome c oxidase subunit 2